MSTNDRWSALSMKDKADLIKLMVENGVTSLDNMRLYYNGGEKPTVERKQYDGKDITIESYKQLQRDKVINGAVQKALTRNRASIPTINGIPQRSCIYTATDNFGNKYKVMGNQTFMANPQKYGFTVAGPLSNNPDENIGRLYQFIDNKKVPYHIAIITNKNEKGEPLISYSKGNVSLEKSRDELEKENYVKNNDIWEDYGYETYKFVGTPEDNIIWENEFNELPNIEVLPTINNYATEELKKAKYAKLKESGGPIGDRDTLNHPKYNSNAEAAMFNYLSNSGLNNAQAAGIMGNLAVESLLNSNINQFNGPAYGLIQAEGARKKALKSYQGNPYVFGSGLLPEEQKQLDYIIDVGINNYTPGEWGKQGYNGARAARKAFIDSSDVNEASDIFMRNYLRPGKPHQERRRKMSNYYFDKYGHNDFIFDDSEWALQNILTK